MNRKAHQRIVMIGSTTPGGVSAVLDVYRATGLLDRWAVELVVTHRDYRASISQKISLAARSFLTYLHMQVRGEVLLLHVHMSARGSFWRKSAFAFMAYLFGTPVVLHIHSGEFVSYYHRECGIAGRFIMRQVLDRATRLIVLSENWKKEIQAITNNRFVVPIPNPVMMERAAKAGLEQREAQTVLFMGQLTPKKGIGVLLEAVASLTADFPDLRLICAGAGDVKEIQSDVIRLGIGERTEFPGWVDGDEKTRLLHTAGIFVLPSFAEGLPMGVIEAMSVGMPIVASRVGGIPDLVLHGSEGLLVPPGNVVALRGALAALLADPGYAREMGDRALQRCEHEFSAAVVIPKIEAIYREHGAVPIKVSA